MSPVEVSSSPNPVSLRSLRQIDGSNFTSNTFFETYRKPGVPIAITGLFNASPEWDLDYLCHSLGDRSFPIREYGRERYQQDKRQWSNMGSAVEAQVMTFGNYAKLLKDGTAAEKDLYLGKCSLTGTTLADAPPLKQVELHLGLKLPITGYNLWVGSGGHVTCLHCDPFDGVLVQLHGRKRILLFPPDQLPNLYPFSMLSHLWYGLKRRASYSQVYPDRPDFVAFPKFRQALQQGYEVILNPGDALFIPVGWWHEVAALDQGVVCSVNRFWSVLPRDRALRSWNKWRIHLGSLLAAPHVVGGIVRSTFQGTWSQFWQKL